MMQLLMIRDSLNKFEYRLRVGIHQGLTDPDEPQTDNSRLLVQVPIYVGTLVLVQVVDHLPDTVPPDWFVLSLRSRSAVLLYPTLNQFSPELNFELVED